MQALECIVQYATLPMQCRLPRLRKGIHQVFDDRVKPPGHLEVRCSVQADFAEYQVDEVVPVGRRKDQPERALIVVQGVVVQVATTDNTQKSMGLIECDNRRSRIVDGLRQCLDGDVGDHPEGKRRILLYGAFRAEGDLGSKRAIAERRGAAVQAEQWFPRGHEIADPRHEVDHAVYIPG